MHTYKHKFTEICRFDAEGRLDATSHLAAVISARMCRWSSLHTFIAVPHLAHERSDPDAVLAADEVNVTHLHVGQPRLAALVAHPLVKPFIPRTKPHASKAAHKSSTQFHFTALATHPPVMSSTLITAIVGGRCTRIRAVQE